MKKPAVIGVVVAVHLVLVGAVLLVPGCGTTTGPRPAPVTGMERPAPMPLATSLPPAPPKTIPTFKPPRPVMPVAPVATKTYTVQAGDSLSLIAKRFNVSTRDIVSMNRIRNANALRVGQKLQLPGYVNLSAPRPVVRSRPKPKTADAAAPVIAAAGGDYTVKSGDSLWTIARAHGTTTKAIIEANSLASDKLKIGQKLSLPGAAPAAGPEGATAMPPAMGEGAAGLVPLPVPGVPLPPETGATMKHTMEAGQDLSEVALIYGVSLDELMRANNLTNAVARPGVTLVIPAAGP